MVCIDRKTIGVVEAEKLARQWAVRFKALQRPASSPMDDFLLSTDDPRVRAARNAGGMDKFGDRKRRTESTWVKCKLRYAAYREVIACGSGRPLTRWSEMERAIRQSIGGRIEPDMGGQQSSYPVWNATGKWSSRVEKLVAKDVKRVNVPPSEENLVSG